MCIRDRNDACGGASNSQHLTGDAIDLKPVDLFVDDFILLVKNSSFKFDQLIKYRNFVYRFDRERCV